MQNRLVCRQDFSGLYVLITSDLFRLLRNRPIRMSVQPHLRWQCFYTHSRITVIPTSRFRNLHNPSFQVCIVYSMQNRLSHWQDSSKSEPYAFRLATTEPWHTSPDVTGRRQRNGLSCNSSCISTDYITDHSTASKVLCRAAINKTSDSYHNADVPLADTGQQPYTAGHWKSTLKDYKIRIYLFRRAVVSKDATQSQ